MKLSNQQRLMILRHINQEYIDSKQLIRFIEENDTIDKRVFDACSKVKIKNSMVIFRHNEYGFNTALYNNMGCVDRDTFIKRIPFIFYFPNNLFNTPLMYNIYSGPRSNDLETVFNGLEFLFYEMSFSLKEIFSYPVNQVIEKSTVSDNENSVFFDVSVFEDAISLDKHNRLYPHQIFTQWVHYIQLCNSLGITDYFPRHFITSYNIVLEASGFKPIIYSPKTNEFETFYRDGLFLICNGVFPRDDDNNPILKWTSIKANNVKSISYSGDLSLPGELKIEITPKSRVYLQVDNEWFSVYEGPLNMDFNCSIIKESRIKKGYTQKEIANAIGVSERTYQKWECGDSCPDGFNLIRIMNWLEIYDVQTFIKHKEIDKGGSNK